MFFLFNLKRSLFKSLIIKAVGVTTKEDAVAATRKWIQKGRIEIKEGEDSGEELEADIDLEEYCEEDSEED